MYVCVYACMYACMHPGMCICMYVCMYVGMKVCMYIPTYIYIHLSIYLATIYSTRSDSAAACTSATICRCSAVAANCASEARVYACMHR